MICQIAYNIELQQNNFYIINQITTKMKTKLFIYSITDRKVSRTYGGTTYKFSVYETTKDNNLKFVTEGKACNRGHKEEDSEAFGCLIKERPELKKMLIRNAKRTLKTDPSNFYAKQILQDIDNSGGYYSFHYENFGLRLKRSGSGV